MVEQQVKNILSKLFKIKIELIDCNTSPDTIEAWDSIMHMNLVLTLEQNFKIKLTEEEIFEVVNYELICEVVKGKLTK